MDEKKKKNTEPTNPPSGEVDATTPLPQLNPIQPETVDALGGQIKSTMNIPTDEDKLKSSYEGLVRATNDAYDTQINGVADFLKEAETEQSKLKAQDENYQRRENAYRYISGLGDTLSGIANLVGTAFGAENQKQTYNAPEVVRKAEENRKARKLEMDELKTRIEEMKTRQSELKSSKNLKEAEMKAAYEKDALALRNQKNKEQREIDALNWEKGMEQKRFEEGKRQFDAEQERLATQSEEKLAADKEIAKGKLEAELLKQQQKNADDPKHQAQTLQKNITGVRDELAKSMGYADYNEYLRYKNANDWGKDIDGQRNKKSRNIRDQRALEYPETQEFLDMLEMPEELTEEQIRMLMGASKVFSDAVGKSTKVEVDDQGREKLDY